MMCRSKIEITIEDAEGAVVVVNVETEHGSFQIIAECSISDRQLRVEGAHIQGLRPGALGRRKLNEIAQKMMEDVDVDIIQLTAGSGRLEPIQAELRNESSLDVVLLLKRAAPIRRPVDLALKLKAFGLGLHDAHRALNRIVADESVRLNLGNADRATIIADLAELGVAAD